MIKVPCLNCNDRNAECHSKCIKYANYKQDLQAYNAIVNKSKNADTEYIRYRCSPVSR